jgi:transposase
MARRTFDVIDLIELYERWWAGRSQVEISASLGIDRKTIRKYLAPAVEAGLLPGRVPAGRPAMGRADWRELAEGWFPQVADAGLRQVTWPAIEPHRDYVVAQLKAGVTQATIHGRLVREKGLDASVASFRRWVAAQLPEETRRARVRVPRPPVPAGSEAQIDYGKLGTWTPPTGGRQVAVWAFVMILSCSRYMFVRPVIRLDQHVWSEATVLAFEFFGGVPARLVPDNLKTGVERPDLYDPRINRSYGELAEHYDTLVDPARAAKPRDKARVERAMPYVRDSFWRGRDFTSLEQMQDDAVDWSVEIAGARRHPSLDGAAPAVVFAAVEKTALQPLPRSRFVVATWSTGKVGPDIHVKVGPALYSVPWRLIGARVEARCTATTVQLVHEQKVVATHLRAERGRRTNYDHYPPEKIAFQQRTPTWCRTTAARVGPSCIQVIEELMVDNALFRLRAAQGILGLRIKHGTDRLEYACTTALTAGDPSYRTIKGILSITAATGTDTAHMDEVEAGQRAARTAAAAAFLRGPDHLFADTPAPDGPPPQSSGGSSSGSSSGSASVSAVVLDLSTTSTTGSTSDPTHTPTTATVSAAVTTLATTSTATTSLVTSLAATSVTEVTR